MSKCSVDTLNSPPIALTMTNIMWVFDMCARRKLWQKENSSINFQDTASAEEKYSY